MSLQELLKSLQLIGAALLIGAGGAYLLFGASRRIRALGLLGALLTAGGASAELIRLASGLGSGALGLGLAEALPLLALQTAVGRSLLLRALVAVVTILCFSRVGRWLLPPLGLGLAVAFALAGHAAAELTGRPVAIAADALHLWGAGLWFGGLLSLLLLDWSAIGLDRLRRHLTRFSRFGVGVMVLLAVTGVALGARRLYGPVALIEQSYGQVLLLKLAFVGGLLTVASGSFWLARSLQGPRTIRRLRALRGCIAAEAVVGLGLLAAAGVLTVTPTPRGEPFRVSLTITDSAFSPAELTVPVHQPVLLTLVNEGAVEHSYVVPGLPHEMISRGHQHGTDAMIAFVKPGERLQVQFVPRKAGRYPVYCMIEGHAEAPSPEVGALVYLQVVAQ